MCDFSKYNVFDIEYQRNTRGNYRNLHPIFREEFMVLIISIGERFTHFWTNIHPWFNSNFVECKTKYLPKLITLSPCLFYSV